jgi:hypothetical protein
VTFLETEYNYRGRGVYTLKPEVYDQDPWKELVVITTEFVDYVGELAKDAKDLTPWYIKLYGRLVWSRFGRKIFMRWA